MLSSSTTLVSVLGLTTPLLGFYDTPDPEIHAPYEHPKGCIFAGYDAWCAGVSTLIDPRHVGCRGAGYWLRNIQSRKRESFVEFLADEEGLKDTHATMNTWLDEHQPYVPEHDHIVVGPLRAEAEAFLKSVTLFVNPDQLSMLVTGAEYHNGTRHRTVTAPFGSGCMQLAPLLEDFSKPQAVIGALDMAMREYLPPDLLAFTMTVPLFVQLAGLDEQSFMHKKFWKELQEARIQQAK